MSVLKLSLILAAAIHGDEAEHALPTIELPPAQARGMASWYGDGALHGRITASGEPIDPDKFTCAHRSLPLQTTVLLVNAKEPGRRVWCRVNDRGPYGARLPDGSYVVKIRRAQPGKWRGIADISVAAARQLGTYGKGLEPVHVHYWPRASRSGVPSKTRREE